MIGFFLAFILRNINHLMYSQVSFDQNLLYIISHPFSFNIYFVSHTLKITQGNTLLRYSSMNFDKCMHLGNHYHAHDTEQFHHLTNPLVLLFRSNPSKTPSPGRPLAYYECLNIKSYKQNHIVYLISPSFTYINAFDIYPYCCVY